MTFVFPNFVEQLDLATTQQLLKAGATTSTLRSLALKGQRMMRSVYARQPGPWSEDQRVLGAMLWAGPPATLTGAAALHLLGLEVDAPSIRRILVPESKRARRSPHGFEVVRTRRMPRTQLRNGVRVATMARALADAGRLRELPRGILHGLTLSALQRRLVLPEHLASELDLGLPGGTHGVRDAVFAFKDGAWSVPEGALIEAVRTREALPAMLANCRLLDSGGHLIGVPDGYFPDAGVVVQVHSKKFHSGTDADGIDRWDSTLSGDRGYLRHGLVVVPVSVDAVRSGSERLLDELEDVVRPRLGFDGSHLTVVLNRG